MTRGFVLAWIGLAFCSCATTRGETIVLHPDGLLQITGTFTSLRVEEERGVFGAEIRIVCSEDPLYQAVIQFGTASFCEPEQLGGEPCFRVSNLVLVEAEFDWHQSRDRGAYLRLRLPDSSGYAGTFEGVVTEEALTGTFVFSSGGTLPVTLHRGPSHWDGDSTSGLGGPSNERMKLAKPAVLLDRAGFAAYPRRSTDRKAARR